jgi:hypothetical protein
MMRRSRRFTCLSQTIAFAAAGLTLSNAGCASSWLSTDELPAESVGTQSAALTSADVEPLGAPVSWANVAFQGAKGTYFADVDGDHKADAVKVDTTSISVRKSTGATPLGSTSTWLSTGFFGSVATYVADVTGEGRADVIAVNSGNIQVRASTGSAFGSAATWSSSAFTGTAATLFADVTGDGKADAVAVNASNVLVKVSSGTGFGSSQTWLSQGLSGTHGLYAADVTGDGKADLVAVGDTSVLVARSTGSAFGTPETWSSNGFFGNAATFVGGITGNGTADLIAVDTTGLRMRRSGRWFFEALPETLSSVVTTAGVTRAVADLTGDGRVEYIESSSSGIKVRTRQDRSIPFRVVQFVTTCSQARTDADIQAGVQQANQVFRDVGISFRTQTVSSNPDCPGWSTVSHVVLSSALDNINGGPATSAQIAKAAPYNPSCNIGYSDMADLPVMEQLKWVGARCALPGEILMNVASVGTNYGFGPGDDSLIFYDHGDGFTFPNGHFAHEIGHYLGLPHTFDTGGFSLRSANVEAATGQGMRPSALWDLVYSGSRAGTQFLTSRSQAEGVESTLIGIETAGLGWFCPNSGGPGSGPCPSTPPPNGTVAIPMGAGVIYTYLPNTTTLDWRMQGLAPRLPGGVAGINTMSYSYAPADPPNLVRGVSLAQIEVMQGNLKTDVMTQYLDATGHVIFARRPLLGITGTTPSVSYVSLGGGARNAFGSIASNGSNTWLVSSTTAPNGGGFEVYEYDGLSRTFVDRHVGAYQVTLPSAGNDAPWAITDNMPGVVKQWDGLNFVLPPADPNGTWCAHSVAIGNHASGNYVWSVGCFGPNSDGNYQIARYTDATGWVAFTGPADGWGTQVASDYAGNPWALTLYNGGLSRTVFRGNLDASGNLLSWTQVPPPSGVSPWLLTGAVNGPNRLPVNFIGSDNHVYVLNRSTSTWTDNATLPFTPAAAGGSLPYLWAVSSQTGEIVYAR